MKWRLKRVTLCFCLLLTRHLSCWLRAIERIMAPLLKRGMCVEAGGWAPRAESDEITLISFFTDTYRAMKSLFCLMATINSKIIFVLKLKYLVFSKGLTCECWSVLFAYSCLISVRVWCVTAVSCIWATAWQARAGTRPLLYEAQMNQKAWTWMERSI